MAKNVVSKRFSEVQVYGVDVLRQGKTPMFWLKQDIP